MNPPPKPIHTDVLKYLIYVVNMEIMYEKYMLNTCIKNTYIIHAFIKNTYIIYGLKIHT
jgi:hypothetical protein